MKYKCIKHAAGLTVGAIYSEPMPYPNRYNAMVTDDEGEPHSYVRDEVFELI